MHKKSIIAACIVLAALAVSIFVFYGDLRQKIFRSASSPLGAPQANPAALVGTSTAAVAAIPPRQCAEYKSVAEALKEPSAVCILNLFNAGLTQIPMSDIKKFTLLQTLNLAGNKLTTIPPEFFSLTNLRSIYLGNNELTEIPSGIGKLENLEFISLFVNKLTTLPPEIANLKKLTFLGLTGNPISKDEQAKIKSWLPKTDIKF